jgi:hypothetical protein
MGNTMDRFIADSARRHAEDVAKGNHDQQCEHGPRVVTGPTGKQGTTFMHMCHCAKRKRLARGRTTLPGPVDWQPPTCPDCCDELQNDDGWYCSRCHVSWGEGGQVASWTDDYGDLGVAPSD